MDGKMNILHVDAANNHTINIVEKEGGLSIAMTRPKIKEEGDNTPENFCVVNLTPNESASLVRGLAILGFTAT